MRVRVGSKNGAKMKAVETGLLTYWPAVDVCGDDVDSGVPGQPIGLDETTTGAINRAKAAYALGGVDLGVGLEGGVITMGGQMVLLGVVAVYDGGITSVAPTMGTPLPAEWAAAINAGAELGPYLAEKFKHYGRNTGAMPHLTNGVIQREEVFTWAVKGALAPWVNPAAFGREELVKAA